KTNGGIVEIHLIVEKGIIKEAKIYGDFFNLKDIAEIENALQNSRHDENSIRKIFENFVIDEYFMNITLDEIISAMF
ncbi:MAG TPA: lipoate protein ligase C-terminal domain-containing protein, partial [Chitinophagaceae bacterium]|nr:lipoate protein ligase C-terminal domain-containing protein [Chitinophagaceae bacterium]